jgi:hypothetical protein
VIEVPALLPLDAHFADEEGRGGDFLEQAGSTGGLRTASR